MTRTCNVCNIEKDLELFPVAKGGKLGRRNQCRECRKAYHRANSKIHYARTRAEKIAKVMAYEAAHIETIRAYQRARYNRPDVLEKERERGRRKYDDPVFRRKQALTSRNYQHKKSKALGYCSKADLEARWKYYGYSCWICSQPAKETDHVKPLSKGGTNWPANLRPICKPCNVRKSNHWPLVTM